MDRPQEKYCFISGLKRKMLRLTSLRKRAICLPFPSTSSRHSKWANLLCTITSKWPWLATTGIAPSFRLSMKCWTVRDRLVRTASHTSGPTEAGPATRKLSQLAYQMSSDQRSIDFSRWSASRVALCLICRSAHTTTRSWCLKREPKSTRTEYRWCWLTNCSRTSQLSPTTMMRLLRWCCRWHTTCRRRYFTRWLWSFVSWNDLELSSDSIYLWVLYYGLVWGLRYDRKGGARKCSWRFNKQNRQDEATDNRPPEREHWTPQIE